MSRLAERAAALAVTARQREAVPEIESRPLTFPWWSIHKPGGDVIQVLVTPPQTTREMMALYPLAGCIPLDRRDYR